MSVLLGRQNCQINVYQKSTGLFLDLAVYNKVIVRTVRCLDRLRIVRTAYQGFSGDLAFADLHGYDDPTYSGLGDRFQLLYLEDGES
nr:hypothetical protein [Bordetella sp. LUAb4]